MREINIQKKSIMKMQNELRICCSNYFISNPILFGGSGQICQIDESLFRHKPKYHRGRASEKEIWVFGIADVSFAPAKVYLQVVNDRSARTLLPIIQSVCRPESIIFSDQWRSYTALNSLNFIHETVNHSIEFVDPETGVHTQNIESFWNKVKMIIKKSKGIIGYKLTEFLKEIMFKENIYRNNFEEIINLIKNYY